MAEIYVPWRTANAESRELAQTLAASAGGQENLEHAWAFDTSQGQLAERVPPDYVFKASSGLAFLRPFVNGRLMLYKPSITPAYTPRRAEVHVALDSNLQTPFTNFALGRELRPEWKSSIDDLLSNGFAWGAQFQPMLYLIENLDQYDIDAAKNNALEIIHATIIVNNMDFKHYEATGRLKMRDGFTDALQRTWNTDDTEQAAHRQFDAMHAQETPPFTNLVMHDLALLKMVQSGLEFSRYGDRVDAFDTFMLELGFYRPSLMVLARLFFHGELGGLLKANVADRNFKIRRLHGAAYDLFISTIPEQMLGMADPDRPQITVVATNDAGLAEFGGRFPVRGIAIQKNGLHRILQDWDEPWLDDKLGKAKADEIRESVGRAAEAFGAAAGTKSLEALQAIGTKLEESLKKMV